MLSFRPTEDQLRLQSRARSFARDVVAPHVAEMDRTNFYPWPVVRGLAAEGFMGLTIPEAYGGAGRPLIDAILVIEELAKVCGTVARICVDGREFHVPFAEVAKAHSIYRFTPADFEGRG